MNLGWNEAIDLCVRNSNIGGISSNWPQIDLEALNCRDGRDELERCIPQSDSDELSSEGFSSI